MNICPHCHDDTTNLKEALRRERQNVSNLRRERTALRQKLVEKEVIIRELRAQLKEKE